MLQLTSDEQSILERLEEFQEGGRLFVDISGNGINVTGVMLAIFFGLYLLGALTRLIDPSFAALTLIFFLGLFFQIGFQVRALVNLIAKQQRCLEDQGRQLKDAKAGQPRRPLSERENNLLASALSASRSRFYAGRH